MDELQKQFQAMRAEITELDGKGVLSGEDATRMADLIQTAQGLRGQIEQRAKVGEIDAWAARSAGMLPLAKGGAQVEGFSPAGETTLVRDPAAGGALRIATELGDGIYDPKVSAKIATPEYKAAFRAFLRTPVGFQPDAAAIRALNEGADSSGGFLVPEEILNRIIAKEPTPTRVAGRVTALNTARDAMVIPKVNYTTDDIYTTGMRVTWTGEVPSADTASRVTDPQFGQERIAIYTALMSILVSNDQIEDTGFDLLGWIAGKFGETNELLRDNVILTGTGVNQPAGILVNPGGDANQPAVLTSGSASAVTAAGLIKTAMSIPEQYDDNVTWVFNKTSTGNAIAQLVDGQQRPLWGAGLGDAGLTAGYKDRMLVGYPVTFSGFMPNVAANAYAAICGDLRGYYLANRIGFSVQVLREKYAETNQVCVLGRVRFGGKVAEGWRMKIHQIHT